MPVFILLQCLDALTTLAFLSNGVAEGNPLLFWGLTQAHAPWIGLVAAKMAATIIGIGCYRKGRMAALRLANTGYSIIVGWNLFVIAITALARM